MNQRIYSILIWMLGLGACTAFATNASIEAGTIYHSGPDEGSMAKKFGYVLGFKAQSSGSFRYEFGGQLEMVSGTVTYASESPKVKVLKALGTGAISLHPFHKYKMSPFFGAQGLGGFAGFESAVPPGSEPVSRTGYIFGYDLFVGTDYALRSEKYLRFKVGLRKMTTTYNSADLDLGGLLATISYVFSAEQ